MRSITSRGCAELRFVTLTVADPIGVGLVNSLERPGGNVTGLSNSRWSSTRSGSRF